MSIEMLRSGIDLSASLMFTIEFLVRLRLTIPLSFLGSVVGGTAVRACSAMISRHILQLGHGSERHRHRLEGPMLCLGSRLGALRLLFFTVDGTTCSCTGVSRFPWYGPPGFGADRKRTSAPVATGATRRTIGRHSAASATRSVRIW